jgi:hypothetical protein
MESMFKAYAGTIIRNLLLPIVAYCAATGLVTEDSMLNLVGAIAPIVVSVVWGLGDKYVWGRKVDEALKTPPPMTIDDIVG